MLVQFGERYSADEYPNRKGWAAVLPLDDLELLAIQHLVSNQIAVKWCGLWALFTWSCFYKDVVRKLLVRRSPLSWRTPVATTVTPGFIFKVCINRCTQPDVHSVTATAVHNFWSFFAQNKCHIQTTCYVDDHVFCTINCSFKEWRVMALRAASITFFTTNTLGHFLCFPITVFRLRS